MAAARARTAGKVTYRPFLRDKAGKENFSKIIPCFEAIDSRYLPTGGNHSLVKRCVANGGNLNLRDSRGFTLVFYAVLKWRVPFVEELCKFKVDLNCKTEEGLFPLWIAIEKLRTEMAVCLLNHGADVNIQAPQGKTPLMRCITEGQATVFDKILETKKCKLDLQDENGLTALHLVIMHCRRSTNGAHFLESLIEQKASITIPDAEGTPPLIKCIETQNVWAMHIIMSKMSKTEIDALYRGMTYLAHCIVVGKIDVALTMIKNHPIDLNAKFGPYRNVFPLAVESGSLALVRELAETGCDFRLSHDGGLFTLKCTFIIEYAFFKNLAPGLFDAEIIKYLIDKYLALGDMSFTLKNHAGNVSSQHVIDFCKTHSDTRMKIHQAYKNNFQLMTTDPEHLMKKFKDSGGRDLIDVIIEFL
ncbi:MAG: hypothetical protein Hyperionvirus3_79 [Hyperionvirus sp.]|uniref:Uncharacterized protein n=1 Tax=Hyperionvirus sp. TaxID=2487770 RepID=A0A3G5AAT5_9VIRU|nr:MAG: hypothetical protein Hyperionvirus3_79 [Hyperionvirus sp.]